MSQLWQPHYTCTTLAKIVFTAKKFMRPGTLFNHGIPCNINFDATRAHDTRIPQVASMTNQSRYCTISHDWIAAPHEFLGCNDFFGQGLVHAFLVFSLAMASIHLYFAGKQVGDTQKRGKPEMRSSCRKSLIGVGPARPRPCKCPPPQIPVSQSPF